MFIFRTSNGATYLVENGRITRFSEKPVLNTKLAIQAIPFTWIWKPEKGQPARFLPKGVNKYEWITTGIVTEVLHAAR